VGCGHGTFEDQMVNTTSAPLCKDFEKTEKKTKKVQILFIDNRDKTKIEECVEKTRAAEKIYASDFSNRDWHQ